MSRLVFPRQWGKQDDQYCRCDSRSIKLPISSSLKRMYALYIALSFCSTHSQMIEVQRILKMLSHLETSAQEGILQRHLIFSNSNLWSCWRERCCRGQQLFCTAGFELLPTGAGFELLSTNWWWLETNFATFYLSQLLSLPSASFMWLMDSHPCTC